MKTSANRKSSIHHYIITGIFIILLIAAFFFFTTLTSFLTGYVTMQDYAQANFSGTYEDTQYNGIGIILSSGKVLGNYTSRVFDASSAVQWKNISWSKSLPSSEIILTADAQADVWSSSNNGSAWTLVKDDYNNGAANNVDGMASDPANRVYILDNQDVWRSTDLGVTWTKVNDDFNGGSKSYSGIVIAADRNDNVYVIDGYKAVYKSTDYGSTFNYISNTGSSLNVFGIAINSTNGIFAVDGSADVWSSPDGVIWTKVNDDYNGAAGNGGEDMAIDRNNVLYILDAQDVWTSSNSGVTWIKINDDFNGAGDSNSGFVMSSDSNNYIYIIDSSQDAYVSTNSGSSFTQKIADFNGANGNVYGITIVKINTDIKLQARSDDDNAGWPAFAGPDGSVNTYYAASNSSVLNVPNNRYFQYKAYFTSNDSSLTPKLYNVTVEYENTTTTIETTITTTTIIPTEIPTEFIVSTDSNYYAPQNSIVITANITSNWVNVTSVNASFDNGTADINDDYATALENITESLWQKSWQLPTNVRKANWSVVAYAFNVTNSTLATNITNITVIAAGPGNVSVDAPSSATVSSQITAVLNVTNKNPYVAQNLSVEYWVADLVNSINYESAKTSVFVQNASSTNITATRAVPATAGTYAFIALVSWLGNSTYNFDTFSATAASTSSTTQSTIPGGSGGGQTTTVTTSVRQNTSVSTTIKTESSETTVSEEITGQLVNASAGENQTEPLLTGEFLDLSDAKTIVGFVIICILVAIWLLRKKISKLIKR